MTKEKQVRTCSECKHFVHVSNVAHQNQCARYAKPPETSIPCAIARPAKDMCDDGKGWQRG